MRSVVVAAALIVSSLSFVPGCGKGGPPIPATKPDEKELVKGTVVAATEASGGVRLYKVVEVEDFPPPLTRELHMVAYEPKASTFEDAARMWEHKESLKVAVDHVFVQINQFMTRDSRIIRNEPVTDAERAGYLKGKRQ